MLNTQIIKKDFPIFQHQPELVYLDSTATSLKPKPVIDKLLEYYQKYSANIFRGVYKISEKATHEYEKTRRIVAEFLNAKNEKEIVFTRNCTESINLIAYSLGRQIIKENDEVITTIMEHHSNFVPWQTLAFENGGVFKVIDIDEKGRLNIGKLKSAKIINKRTKILALTYISNVLGTINPVKKIIQAVKEINPKIITIVDAAQAAPHLKIDVTDLDCDFVAFSSHKMLGPTGVGVLWGREKNLREMFPFQYGGEMIDDVAIEKTTFKDTPHKFEAGTPDIAGVIAQQAAILYLKNIGWDQLKTHEKDLTNYGIKSLKDEFGEKINILGPDLDDRSGIISFTLSDIHPHDIAQILDEENIAIRAGHHCAMPLHKRLKINASARASFYLYNDKSDIDRLVEGLRKAEKVFRY